MRCTHEVLIRRVLRVHVNGHSHPNHFQKQFRVPIGETETTVRFRPAHIFRSRRTVNAIAGFIEADPHYADGVIRAGRQDEFNARLLLCFR